MKTLICILTLALAQDIGQVKLETMRRMQESSRDGIIEMNPQQYS